MPIGSQSWGSGPSIKAQIDSESRNIMAAGYSRHGHKVMRVTLSSAAVDAGNTPTTTLRAGLILGMLDATGEYVAHDVDAAGTGEDQAAGILLFDTDMLDYVGTAEDKIEALMLTHGPVLADMLVNDTVAARAQLRGKIIFDDDMREVANVNPYAQLRMDQIGSTPLTIADTVNCGQYFFTAATMVVNLPAIADGGGQFFRFFQTGATSLTINPKSGETDNIFALGNAQADTVVFNTASEIIGNLVVAESFNGAAGVPEWAVYSLTGATATPSG